MRRLSQHTEWLSLIEVSGPFLTTSVLEKNFPQGLEFIDTHLKQRLRSAYDEWRDAVEDNDPQLAELHLAWNQLVLRELFEFEDSVLFSIHDNDDLTFKSLDSDGRFVPDFALRLPRAEKPTLLISVLPEGTNLDKVKTGDEWPVSIHERMVLLCREKGIRFGLITNGEQWMLIQAPIGSTSSSVSWYAHLWFQEEVTLRAFQSLLGIRRWFGPEERSLAAMLDESLKHHEEITDTLGEQVRRAVEVLVQSLDKADQDRNRELLENVTPTELYEAGLTVMMRLVFILCAEERGLLLLGDPVYDQYYAITTLRAQLVEESERHGHEVLERRHDGWTRLLAIFRILYGGVEHDTLRMPALGGSLFDPNRFSFLEGRPKGTSWKDTPAQALPIDNRTVLLLLEALQVIEQKGGALLLSYRALDVEQIGHVYEGLLEYTVQRMTNDTLGLVGSQKVKYPNITLAELESAGKKDTQKLVSIIKDTTERSESAIENALRKKEDDHDTVGKILVASGGDMSLANRIYPYVRLMRRDAWGDFIVYQSGSFAVTHGADRRETGTHYTPKSLTECIVETTLRPIVYIGPADDKPRAEWQLKSSAELLELKICDPAMGSGAFLVQVCRYLSERLVEAWGREETEGKFLTVDGEALNEIGSEEPMPSSLDERLLIARRLIAERCLYGVDLNPLAVELAKLSIWLITLAKGRPFGFLDHNLRSGDSLLGLHKLEQLTKFSLQPDKKQTISLFASNIDAVVKEVVELRKELRAIPIRDIRDIQYMEHLDKESRKKLKHIEYIADAIIGEALVSNGNGKTLEVRLDNLSNRVREYILGDNEIGEKIIAEARKALSYDLPDGRPPRKPFHWVLEFPEVFTRGGFDGIVGNPPFIGGQKITGSLGVAYRNFLVHHLADGQRGTADLCAYFFLRNSSLLLEEGYEGFLATNTIAQGDSREVGLQKLQENGFSIIAAIASQKWPGKANLEVAIVWLKRGEWLGVNLLNGQKSKGITSYLTEPGVVAGSPFRLKANEGKSFIGALVLGMGFVLDRAEVNELLRINPKNKEIIFPYLNGQDLNSRPDQSNSRWVINFFDWPLKRDNLIGAWNSASEKQRKVWLSNGIVPLDYPHQVAADYPECLAIIEEKVKPERMQINDKTGKKYWWRFLRIRPELNQAISGLGKVIVRARVSNTNAITFVPEGIIGSEQIVVFASNRMEFFAVMQSIFHSEWLTYYSSSLRTDIRYTPSDCFETFPFPEFAEEINSIGEQYYNHRINMMGKLQEGLTKVYNYFNDPVQTGEMIAEFRDLQIQMDRAVAKAYGWNDLELCRTFYTTKQGMRFTVSEDTRRKILQLLLKLNHERYGKEVHPSLSNNKGNINASLGKKKSKVDVNSNLNLFE